MRTRVLVRLDCWAIAFTCISLLLHPIGLGHAAEAPRPLVRHGEPVDWWFVFKFNAATAPACAGGAQRQCIFGGSVQTGYGKSYSQQFIFASSKHRTLQEGADCVGGTEDDPVGASFKQVFSGPFHYVIWNDQFYQDPTIHGCGNACGRPWGHSKGVLAWDDAGEGFVMQVTSPNWPGAGHSQPSRINGNTLGCLMQHGKPHNNVKVSQHFFSVRLSKADVLTVLQALQVASVVTDTANSQIVKLGGPHDIQEHVRALGSKVKDAKLLNARLSTGVSLIAKPSSVKVPPWHLASAVLGGVNLRVASWWQENKAQTAIPSTDAATDFDCWRASLGKPGSVEIAKTGRWRDDVIGLRGGPGPKFNHAKFAVSTSGSNHYVIFGDLNQEGVLSGPDCKSSQNGRGGLFFVVEDSQLHESVSHLISGETAPVAQSRGRR